MFSVWENEAELAQLAEIVRYTKSHRVGERPLDIVIIGVANDPQESESVELVEQRAALGATWWLEAITPYRAGKDDKHEWPLDAMRERILQGPPMLG